MLVCKCVENCELTYQSGWIMFPLLLVFYILVDASACIVWQVFRW